jgi:hypothetical protein
VFEFKSSLEVTLSACVLQGVGEITGSPMHEDLRFPHLTSAVSRKVCYHSHYKDEEHLPLTEGSEALRPWQRQTLGSALCSRPQLFLGSPLDPRAM